MIEPLPLAPVGTTMMRVSALRPLLLIVALVLAPATAHALTWWVPNVEDGLELNDALQTWWPDHDIAVRVGSPTYQRNAIWYAGGELVMVAGERVRWQATASDYATQVALVRSWLREDRAPAPGWIPRPSTPRVAGFATVSGGAGARLPTIGRDLGLGPASPAGHLLLSGGIAWPWFRIGIATAGTLGETAGNGLSSVAITRLFVGGTVSLTAPAGPLEIENVIGVGARLVVLRAKELSIDPTTVRLASFLLGLRMLGRLSPLVAVGGGVGIGIDASPIFVQLGPDYDPQLLSPVTLYAEVVVSIGGAR